jgi:methylated-DNA-[protein]-cysteine S-methyltransferase
MAAYICETAGMHYTSRVATFATRRGNCSLRLTAGASGIQSLELNPTSDPVGPQDDSYPPIREALRQLEAYFAGERAVFDLPLDMSGTTFQKRVWQALLEIPYGATCSYLELATVVGNPAAVRAVGAANGRNPIAIVVPCHRVIGANGKLVGYGGGLPMKQMLLELEKDHAERLGKAAAR